MAVTYNGVVGTNVGTSNETPLTVEFSATAGYTYIALARQGRALVAPQTQSAVTWTAAGWTLLSARTVVRNPDGSAKDFGFVSQAIFGYVPPFNDLVTLTIDHTGLAGGFADVDVIEFAEASGAELVAGQSGVAANPTPAQSWTAPRTIMHLTSYADSSGSTPSWNTLNGFTSQSLNSISRLGMAFATGVAGPGTVDLPRVQGAAVNAALDRFPWVMDTIRIRPRGRPPGHYLGLRR